MGVTLHIPIDGAIVLIYGVQYLYIVERIMSLCHRMNLIEAKVQRALSYM